MRCAAFWTAAIALTLLAACQTDVSFRSSRIFSPTEEVDRIPGFLAKSEGNGPFPAVVVLHSCGGAAMHVNAGWREYFTARGYVVLIVDTFGARGYQRCPNPL